MTLLEYRNKTGSDAEMLADAAILRAALPAGQVKLILDDRVDLVEETDFDGVHVDAGDATPVEARRLLGPERIVGTFGGSEALLPGILKEPVDYLSIGPVFPTTTKQTSKAPIGVEGVRKLREEAGPDAVLVARGRDHAGDCAGRSGCGSQRGRCFRGDLSRTRSGGRVPALGELRSSRREAGNSVRKRDNFCPDCGAVGVRKRDNFCPKRDTLYKRDESMGEAQPAPNRARMRGSRIV